MEDYPIELTFTFLNNVQGFKLKATSSWTTSQLYKTLCKKFELPEVTEDDRFSLKLICGTTIQIDNTTLAKYGIKDGGMIKVFILDRFVERIEATFK